MIYDVFFGLERYFPGNALRSAVLPKLAINISTAPIGIAIAFTSIAFYRGKSMSEAKSKIENDLVPTYIKGGNNRQNPIHFQIEIEIEIEIADDGHGCGLTFDMTSEAEAEAEAAEALLRV